VSFGMQIMLERSFCKMIFYWLKNIDLAAKAQILQLYFFTLCVYHHFVFLQQIFIPQVGTILFISNFSYSRFFITLKISLVFSPSSFSFGVRSVADAIENLGEEDLEERLQRIEFVREMLISTVF
jgi:hypothetical protein